MKKIITTTIILLFAINLPKAQTGLYVPELAGFDDAMINMMYQYSVPGGQLAIAYHGKLVYSRGFGFANVTTQDSVQPNSTFRLASVSKPITAIAIMTLFQDGLINLDAKVFGVNGILNDSTYSDILDSRVYDITVRNLLQHSGGWNIAISGDPMFNAYNIAIAMGTVPPAGPATVIQYVLANQLLDFDPGTQYQYSNFGFCILGKVIEKITGQTYEEYVRNTILIPLEITTMKLGYNLEADQLPEEVNYYDYPGAPMAYSVYDNSTIVPWPYGGFNLEAMDAHGRWVGSAQDLCRLLVAVDKFSTVPDILSTATIDTMIKPSLNNPNYALGWAVNIYNNWWHNGSIPGTTTEIIRDGNDQINWAILLNTRTQNVGDISTAVDELVWNVLPTISSWPSFDLFTGVDPVTASTGISVHPNPSSAYFQVSCSDRIQEIVVTDLAGRELYREKMNTLNPEISTRGFENGIYFVHASTGDKVTNAKILVCH